MQHLLDRVEVRQVRLVLEVERRRVRLEQEADVLREQQVRLERAGAAGADRRDRDLLILELAGALDRLERGQAGEALGVGRILDQVGPVGEHRRLVDAAEAAGGVDRAGEEGEVLGQVRQVDLGQLLAGVVARPLEGLGDRVEVRVAVVAHHAVAFEHALHEPLHDLRVGLGEAAVQHHHVGDDQQVLVGDEDLGDAAALLDDLADGRLPGHRAGELVGARLDVVEEQLAGLLALLGVDRVDAIGAERRRRRC